MIVDAYVVGYIQVYLFRNFDEAPGIGRREAAGLLVCSLIHGSAAHLLGWFDGRRQAAVLVYAVYDSLLSDSVCV